MDYELQSIASIIGYILGKDCEVDKAFIERLIGRQILFREVCFDLIVIMQDEATFGLVPAFLACCQSKKIFRMILLTTTLERGDEVRQRLIQDVINFAIERNLPKDWIIGLCNERDKQNER